MTQPLKDHPPRRCSKASWLLPSMKLSGVAQAVRRRPSGDTGPRASTGLSSSLLRLSSLHPRSLPLKVAVSSRFTHGASQLGKSGELSKSS